MRKFIVEFIGTFFLVSGAIYGGAIGASLSLIVMIYAGGHISGAHYNPAVTTAMYLRKKVTLAELPGYYIAQFLGGAVAALMIYYVFEKQGHIEACDGFSDGLIKVLLAEVIGTFALAYVVLNVATAKGTAGNSFYGLAIGGTVLAMAWTVGTYSGGVFNPAVGLSLSIHKTLCWDNLWLFFVAPVVGGVLAALLFNYLNEADDEEPESIPEEQVFKTSDNTQQSK
jgi:aquaporin Z